MSILREHRLRKHAEFELVYRNGRRHFSSVLTAFYLLREGSRDTAGATADIGKEAQATCGTRVGITVGRGLGKSTARNRIKRRVRAAVTQNLARITRPIDVVINPKKAVLEIEFQDLCSEISRAFDVIEQKALPARTDDHTPSVSPARNQKEGRGHKPGRMAARKT